MNRLRIGLALAGFVLALLSVALDDHRLAWAAIAVLATSLLIRLVRRKRESRKSQGDDGL
jgi:membrane protein implicated in regulation of membrane protease activity